MSICLFVCVSSKATRLRYGVGKTNATLVAMCCSVLQCVAVCCRVLQCIGVCCSVLQRVAACCSVLQRVAVCCSVLQCVDRKSSKKSISKEFKIEFFRKRRNRVQPGCGFSILERGRSTTTPCTTLRHTATHRNTLQHTAKHYCVESILIGKACVS